MAKKTVATLHEGSKDGRAYTKVIKMVREVASEFATSFFVVSSKFRIFAGI